MRNSGADPAFVFMRLRLDAQRLSYLNVELTDSFIKALDAIQPRYIAAYEKHKALITAPKQKPPMKHRPLPVALSQAIFDAGAAARRAGEPYNNPHDETVEPYRFQAYHGGYNSKEFGQ